MSSNISGHMSASEHELGLGNWTGLRFRFVPADVGAVLAGVGVAFGVCCRG